MAVSEPKQEAGKAQGDRLLRPFLGCGRSIISPPGNRMSPWRRAKPRTRASPASQSGARKSLHRLCGSASVPSAPSLIRSRFLPPRATASLIRFPRIQRAQCGANVLQMCRASALDTSSSPPFSSAQRPPSATTKIGKIKKKERKIEKRPDHYAEFPCEQPP